MSNFEYYSTDDELNNHIDNILTFKNYIDSITQDIKRGDYDTNTIKKLSKLSEDYFLNDNSNEYKFNPKIVEINSDTSDDDSEITTIYSPSENSSNRNYNTSLLTNYEPYDNTDPDFLDEQTTYSSKLDYNNPKEISNIGDLFDTKSNDTDTEYKEKLYDKYMSLAKESQTNYTQIDYNKPKDKLINDFLNNSLKLENYYYPKIGYQNMYITFYNNSQYY
jgi:hypothetical protein